MTVTTSEHVRRHFDGTADRFDLIYQKDKTVGQRLVDRLFRQVIHHRYQLTFQWCGDVAGKRILDVGCGTGRYAVEFARRGARVVGVDFAAGMLATAEEHARRAGVADRCTFVQTDFLSWSDPQPFDVAVAIGFFDYIADPRVFLARLHEMAAPHAVCSFPKRWTLRSPTRWLRLKLSGCPVRFYGYGEVNGLFSATGWGRPQIHRLSRDYLVQAGNSLPAAPAPA